MIQMDIFSKMAKFKNNYEIARQKRIEVVNAMEELDNKISEIEKEIKNSKINLKNTHFYKMRNKQTLKSLLLIPLIQWLITLIITAIINALTINKFGVNPIGMITSAIAIVTFNIIQYKITNPKEKNYKKRKFKDLENLESEHSQLLKQRISKGQEYKHVREAEVQAEMKYKEILKILDERINDMETSEKIHSNSNMNQIDTRDIYSTIKLGSSFNFETIENKRIILDNELRKYLASKISQLYCHIVDTKKLEYFSVNELIEILLYGIKKENHNEVLSNIIHAILNFAANLQGYGVVWYEENNIELITFPEVVFDATGKWTELKTHKNTNYQRIFQLVYDTFLNKVMKEAPQKKRTL